MPQTLDAIITGGEIPPGTPTVTVGSDLLGAIELPAEALYTFPHGLYGFETARTFALVPAGREGLFWMQSAEDRGLVFLVADPFQAFPAYEVDVPETELAVLGRGAPSPADAPLGVLTIVTLPATAGEAATVNLRAPVLLEPETRRGRQLVLRDERWGVRERLTLD